MKNIKFISLINLFKDGIKHEPAVSLRNFIELPVLVKRIGWRIVLTLFTSRGKVNLRLRQMHNFYNYVLIKNKNHGSKYCVAYLKTSQLAIQKAIAKDKISSLRELDKTYAFPRLSSCGLPRYIPLSDRRAIMSGSKSIIRWWLTLYSIFRIVTIPGELKLATITDPYSGCTESLQRVSLELKAFALRSKRMFDLTIVQKEVGLQFTQTASPSHYSSWTGMFTDPFKLAKAGLGQYFLDYMFEMKYSNLLATFVRIFKYSLIVEKLFDKYWYKKKVSGVGQLSAKEEAAGKVRVFAMVDIWTQSLLKPLHNMLFSFLRSLPNDGTFDQRSSCIRASEKSIKSGCSFGYDLSAATDRLPIALQVAILSPLIGEKCATIWRNILVDRDYVLRYKDETHKVRYSVGQPMGALSSWAMLAVTHHFIVQMAAYRTFTIKDDSSFLMVKGIQWFVNYELLGDDIVIFDKLVAQQYLSIMASIGVPINESKSVIAKNATVEFAKVTMHKGTDVSALSWKMFISQNNIMGRINILYSLINKGYYPKHNIVQWIDDVTRAQMRSKSNLTLILIPMLSMFVSSSKISADAVLGAITDWQDSVSTTSLLKGNNQAYLINLVVALIKGTPLRLSHRQFSNRWYLEWLVKSIKVKFDPFIDHKDMAIEIVDGLFPEPRDTYDTMIKYNAMRVAFITILKDLLFPLLNKMSTGVPNFFRSVDEGLKVSEDLDMYSQMRELYSNALRKAGQQEKTLPSKPRFSLKLVKVLLKVQKFKEKWEEKNKHNQSKVDPDFHKSMTDLEKTLSLLKRLDQGIQVIPLNDGSTIEVPITDTGVRKKAPYHPFMVYNGKIK